MCTWHTTMWLLCAKLKLAYGSHPWTAPSRMLWAAVGHPPTLRSLSSSSSVTGLPMKLSYHLQEISLIGLHIFSFLHEGKTLIFLPTPGSGNAGRLGHWAERSEPVGLPTVEGQAWLQHLLRQTGGCVKRGVSHHLLEWSSLPSCTGSRMGLGRGQGGRF